MLDLITGLQGKIAELETLFERATGTDSLGDAVRKVKEKTGEYLDYVADLADYVDPPKTTVGVAALQLDAETREKVDDLEAAVKGFGKRCRVAAATDGVGGIDWAKAFQIVEIVLPLLKRLLVK